MIFLQAGTAEMVSEGLSITLPTIILLVGMIIFVAGIFLSFFYKHKVKSIFQTSYPVDPTPARITYAGEGGDPYNSIVTGEIIMKDSKIYATLQDGTRLSAVEEDDYEIVKNAAVWRGEPQITCRIDGNNKVQKWAAPEMVKAFLKGTEFSKEKIRQEVKEDMLSDLEWIAKAESASEKIISKKKESVEDIYT